MSDDEGLSPEQLTMLAVAAHSFLMMSTFGLAVAAALTMEPELLGEGSEREVVLAKKRKVRTGKDRKPRVLSAFNMFIKDVMSKRDPQSTIPETMRAAGVAWQRMSEDEKRMWQSQADQYNAEHYPASGRSGLGAELAAAASLQGDDAGAAAAHEPPRRPIGPFLRYRKEVEDQVRAEMPGASFNDVIREVANRWKKLSEEERQVYDDSFKAAREGYLAQIELWRQTYGDKALAEYKANKKHKKHKAGPGAGAPAAFTLAAAGPGAGDAADDEGDGAALE